MEPEVHIIACMHFDDVVDAQVLSDYVKTNWRDYRNQFLGKHSV